jgi:hypothetical protein
MSSYDKAMDWLRKHEPQVAEQCMGRADQVQDFLGYKDFSYTCKQVFSGDRWALIGEAGAFLDPFYSPGSDYIGIGNTLVTDLIMKDFAGDAVATYASYYERIYFTFFENHLTLYEGQMHLWGDAKVMSLKIIWDFAYYWVIPAAFFFHGQLTNVMLFARHKPILDRAGDAATITATTAIRARNAPSRLFEANAIPPATDTGPACLAARPVRPCQRSFKRAAERTGPRAHARSRE